jgi:hypothetical protein
MTPGRRYAGARSGSIPPPPAIKKPSGCGCSCARCPSSPAVLARIGTAFTTADGIRGRPLQRRSAARRSWQRVAQRPGHPVAKVGEAERTRDLAAQILAPNLHTVGIRPADVTHGRSGIYRSAYPIQLRWAVEPSGDAMHRAAGCQGAMSSVRATGAWTDAANSVGLTGRGWRRFPSGPGPSRWPNCPRRRARRSPSWSRLPREAGVIALGRRWNPRRRTASATAKWLSPSARPLESQPWAGSSASIRC